MRNVPRTAPFRNPLQHGMPPRPDRQAASQSPSMLTISDISRRFQISRRQIYRCIDRGELPAATHRLGRKAAWPTSVIEKLEAWWAEQALAEMNRRNATMNRPL
jgi:predicted DNA-binding transcriptional regulator AlpA